MRFVGLFTEALERDSESLALAVRTRALLPVACRLFAGCCSSHDALAAALDVHSLFHTSSR